MCDKNIYDANFLCLVTASFNLHKKFLHTVVALGKSNLALHSNANLTMHSNANLTMHSNTNLTMLTLHYTAMLTLQC